MTAITEHTLRTGASTEELERIRHFVADHARSFGFGENDISDIQLAVDEACTNVIKHAYQWDATKEIIIRIAEHKNEFLISIFDNGKPFDPKAYRLPTTQDQLEQKKRSGYGILLIRKLMDNVEYRKRKSRNEIRMTKKL
ncbi:ATP-binding protein [Balneolales bacterium ANBcel1]|nr:ATP-binding protein [Balneolales bacterium ANBcel1]